MAVPSDATLEALERLSADPKNVVYIISGRDGEFLEEHLGHLKNVGFSAEHGGFVRERGSSVWTNFTESLDMSWMAEVEEIFRYYTEVRFPFVLYSIILGLSILFHDHSAPKAAISKLRRAPSPGTTAVPTLNGVSSNAANVKIYSRTT